MDTRRGGRHAYTGFHPFFTITTFTAGRHICLFVEHFFYSFSSYLFLSFLKKEYTAWALGKKEGGIALTFTNRMDGYPIELFW